MDRETELRLFRVACRMLQNDFCSVEMACLRLAARFHISHGQARRIVRAALDGDI